MGESAPAEPLDNERRVAQRLRTLKRARVMFNNRFSTIDCVVRNVSRTGALLTVDTAVHLPKIFEISIVEEEARPARLVYRRGMFAGIHFTDVEAEESHVPASSGSQAAGEPETIARIRPATLPRALRSCLPWTLRAH